MRPPNDVSHGTSNFRGKIRIGNGISACCVELHVVYSCGLKSKVVNVSGACGAAVDPREDGVFLARLVVDRKKECRPKVLAGGVGVLNELALSYRDSFQLRIQS